MGYIFEHNDITVWEPSLNLGKLFLYQLKYFEDRVERSSGITEPYLMPDTVEIDFASLKQFMLHVAKIATPQNQSFRMLSKGIFAHLLAFLLWEDDAEHEIMKLYPDDWVQEAHEICKHRYCHESKLD